MQVFVGPRQVGKTTAAVELSDSSSSVFFSADAPSPPSSDLIEVHWNKARAIPSEKRTLILDEVQKIPGWSEVVKRLWDEDQREKRTLRVGILGSSALLIQKGLSESLTGRFETHFFPHWTFGEVQLLHPITVEQYLRFGGYPKAYAFLDDLERGLEYISNSIIEPTLGRDILALHAVDKPALLRQLFWYVSKLPAHIVSFEKILGALQDRGNSATLVHYAELLRLAFLVVPIFKYSTAPHRTKRSLPKWIFPNVALVDVPADGSHNSGFVFENLIGSHILNITYGESKFELKYWREGDDEIDYVLTFDQRPLFAIEVKSGRKRGAKINQLLKQAKLACPAGIVSSTNVEAFLQTGTIEEIVKIVA